LLDTYGWAQHRQGEHAKAMAALERAFERAPDSGAIRYHLALAQAQAGQLEKAIKNLEIAVASPRGFAGLAEARTLLVDLKARSS
jgi:tetratricopeptide (TPR) repeat protein